jgi:phosphatidate phosphatase APP1
MQVPSGQVDSAVRARGGWAARAARFETAVERRLALVLWRHGWRPRVVPYTGYGVSTPEEGWVRVLARVVLVPPASQPVPRAAQRGWRHYLTLSLPAVEVAVAVGGREQVVRSGLGGYVDVVLPGALPPGWHDLPMRAGGTPTAVARVRVVGAEERVGVVSDVDDTVMVTAIPRPLLAFWNSFVRFETSRHPVPGMPELFAALAEGHRDPFVVYLSTGAWNVAPSVQRFLRRHGYPHGPLLMTDWGPTPDCWFRSGRAHKHASLRRLVTELPWLTWALVGDDGQHDPALYDELVADAPGRVRLVAIRELTATQQVLTHGTPGPLPDAAPSDPPTATDHVPRLRAPDGFGLLRELRRLAVAPGRVGDRTGRP